jgi:hypothetical protein
VETSPQRESGAKKAQRLATCAAGGALIALGLGLALAGCDTGGATSTRSPAATATLSSMATTTTGPASQTGTALPGSGNLVGATDICTATVSVNTALPADIPAYDAQLRLADTNNGNGEYGYCVNASVDAIASFYMTQLPGKGWQSIQKFDNNATRNIIASRGKENLTITVSPDVLQSGSTDLLIIEQGQGA